MKDFLIWAAELLAACALGILKIIWHLGMLFYYTLMITLIIFPFIKPGDDWLWIMYSYLDPIGAFRSSIDTSLFIRHLISAFINAFTISAILIFSGYGLVSIYFSKIEDKEDENLLKTKIREGKETETTQNIEKIKDLVQSIDSRNEKNWQINHNQNDR
jgi:hypothetical protein